MTPSTLGELVVKHRMRLGVTQRELAGRAGLSERALRDIESDRVRRPRTGSLQGLAAALELSDVEHTAMVAALAAGVRPGGASLSVAVLGPLSVRRDGRPVDISSAMLRDLLGLLALQPHQVVSGQEIIDVLWEEHPPKTCSRLVHVYIGQLRALTEPGRQARSQAHILVRATGGYRLDMAADQLDLVRFDDLLARAGRSHDDGELAAAQDLLGQALACWRGPLLAEASDRLRQHPAAVAVRRRRVAAALNYADLALVGGDHDRVVDRLREVVCDEPLHEGLAARLMLALAGRGEQVAALELFNDIRIRLDEELGITPGAELDRAHLRVLRHRNATPVAGRVASPTPAQLPADVAAFTGRAEHLERLDSLLHDHRSDGGSAVVISAISGTAGVGKTALALHWAHRVRDRFGDGQLHVDLRGYAPSPPLQPIEALARFLHALGVPAEQIPGEAEEAAGMYRSLLADKRMLIVLDNARNPDQVRPLLPGSPNCLVLITSRDELAGLVAREGAWRITLDMLTPDEADTLLIRLLGADRVLAERQATTDLAKLCAFLPLALRIAAANVIRRPHDNIASYTARLRVGNRLAALEVGGGDRQAAVRCAFDLSYAALSTEAGRLFRLLGQLPGPDITADAAAALAGVTRDGAVWLLSQLCAAHLVHEHSSGRYTLHDLLRLYAAEQATSDDGERQAAQQRLFDHYLRTADAAAKRLYPQILRLPPDDGTCDDPRPKPPQTTDELGDHKQASAWLDAERHNLVAAIRHAAARGPRPVAWLLADTLRGYFILRMFTVDWRTAAVAALSAAEAEDQPSAQAAALLSLANLRFRQDQHPSAIDHCHRALALARHAGWRDGQAAALGYLGIAYGQLGQLRRSVDHLTQAMALNRANGLLAGEANNLGNLGTVYGQLGRLRQSADSHTEALALFRKIGSLGSVAAELAILGEINRRLGRLDHALVHLMQAMTLQREIGDRGNECETIRVIAAVHRDGGRHTTALEHAQAALTLARDTGERRYETDILNVLATINDCLGRHEQSVAEHRLALELAREIGNRYPEAEGHIGLAAAHAHLGQYDQAVTAARQALNIAGEAEFRMLEGQALTALAAIHLDQGCDDQATRHARAAIDLHRETGHRHGLANALLILGKALVRIEGVGAALPRWREALDVCIDIGTPETDHIRDLLLQYDPRPPAAPGS